jgi:hypothetical protein
VTSPCDITGYFTFTVKALRPIISSKDHDKIRALQRNFEKLKEDFDRTVNMEVLMQTRKSGNNGFILA